MRIEVSLRGGDDAPMIEKKRKVLETVGDRCLGNARAQAALRLAASDADCMKSLDFWRSLGFYMRFVAADEPPYAPLPSVDVVTTSPPASQLFYAVRRVGEKLKEPWTEHNFVHNVWTMLRAYKKQQEPEYPLPKGWKPLYVEQRETDEWRASDIVLSSPASKQTAARALARQKEAERRTIPWIVRLPGRSLSAYVALYAMYLSKSLRDDWENVPELGEAVKLLNSVSLDKFTKERITRWQNVESLIQFRNADDQTMRAPEQKDDGQSDRL
jgi:hypothetical protein